MALELAKRKAEEKPTDLEAAGTSHGPTTSEPAISVGDLLGLLAEDNTLQKPSIFLGRVQVHEQTFLSVDQEQLPFVWKTGNSGDNSNGMFHPDGNFREKTLPFSRFSRIDQNFLYHLCGSLVPGFKWTESENFTGIL